MKFRIFCDFDGTLTQNDVGNLIFTKFGDATKWWDLVEDWQEGRLEGRQLWLKQAEHTRMTEKDVEEFVATQPIDPSFPDFVAFCRGQKIPLIVVSDGMDTYIKRILEANGLGDLPVRCNRMEISSEGALTITFPYYEQGCGVCANCKGMHVENESQPDETTVYIGDGYSDTCALAVADITFAKKDLLEYCREKNVPCIPFHDFSDVQKELERLLRQGMDRGESGFKDV
jgi:2-hydroxy-3-keto-5-methylthiopentenyl-1-phosphate phosphatase